MKEGIRSYINCSNGSDESIERLLEDVPCLSAAAVKAQQILNQPELIISELVLTLETDPYLVAKILKIANSAFYGLSRQIATIRDACIVLGQHTLRNIILTAAIVDIVKHHNMEESEYKNLWIHFLHTAVITRDLAKRTGLNGDTSYIVGLLHDIGRMFIGLLLPDHAMKIREIMEKEGTILETAENEILGFDHAEFSGAIARHWKLPEEIVLPMSSHHDVNNESLLIYDVIHVADVLSYLMLADEEESEISNLIDVSTLERLGFTEQSITEYMQQCISPENIELTEILG